MVIIFSIYRGLILPPSSFTFLTLPRPLKALKFPRRRKTMKTESAQEISNVVSRPLAFPTKTQVSTNGLKGA